MSRNSAWKYLRGKYKILTILCFDTKKDIETQKQLLDTLILLNKNRHLQVQYYIVTDINHSNKLLTDHEVVNKEHFISELCRDIVELKHANYLFKAPIPIYQNLDFTGNVFKKLKNTILP